MSGIAALGMTECSALRHWIDFKGFRVFKNPWLHLLALVAVQPEQLVVELQVEPEQLVVGLQVVLVAVSPDCVHE